ncbi:XdhC protein (assists in molybdopterin insertion into xanthine dehydrogenase) [Caballeronia glathei]|jgi:xanthine dehydrogenase accessory factor|uniref:Adenosine deaminase n=1 Tax=Caballeronia glathei TaxID=60547 RepID=A0A069Q402_9BURK|nr:MULTISPECIES: xanthine dehydrogenase accessory protein XdhC [Burkholderiaceae]KDR44511.1 adenosine deaminase [Caballeronia glathei]TCK44381.1 molybdenum cofactor sulfurylase [Paraburkholderia sp. BL8N3]CDY74012.1 XdhC protein (assists in molybdopterin insertion into xanthine dehydrogenase) [Caballeronia glathei]
MQAWLHDLQQLLAHGDAVVLVTVARIEGSAPREPGTKMIVTREEARYTIGGGHLEWKAIETARQVLRDGMRSSRMRRLERFALGPSLGQCCGGAVVLAFERLDVSDLGWVTSLGKRTAQGLATVRSVSFGASPDAVMISDPEPGVSDPDCLLWDGAGFDDSGALLTETIAPREFPVVLFGAGHVGAALVRVLATLPCRVTWVDERDASFPAAQFVPDNVTIDANDAPDSAVDAAPPHTYFVVMTHNHTVDLVLAERILRRGDFAFFGMIGSHTKRKQFEHRLAARGIDPARIARMMCPIGVGGIVDKSPEIIAVAAAAQLLQAVEANAHAHSQQMA